MSIYIVMVCCTVAGLCGSIRSMNEMPQVQPPEDADNRDVIDQFKSDIRRFRSMFFYKDGHDRSDKPVLSRPMDSMAPDDIDKWNARIGRRIMAITDRIANDTSNPDDGESLKRLQILKPLFSTYMGEGPDVLKQRTLLQQQFYKVLEEVAEEQEKE